MIMNFTSAILIGMQSSLIDQKGKDLLIKIKDEIENHYSFELIEFSSQNQMPLSNHEKPRLAVTRPYIGAPIVFNLDVMYEQKNRSLSLTQAISILIHEFGHHHQITGHQYLDHLGSIVASSAEPSISLYPESLSIDSNVAVLTTIQAKSFDVLSFILIKNNIVIDLKEEIALLINSNEFKIFNIHWNRMGLLEAQIFFRDQEKLIHIDKDGKVQQAFF